MIQLQFLVLVARAYCLLATSATTAYTLHGKLFCGVTALRGRGDQARPAVVAAGLHAKPSLDSRIHLTCGEPPSSTGYATIGRVGGGEASQSAAGGGWLALAAQKDKLDFINDGEMRVYCHAGMVQFDSTRCMLSHRN
jgi:hypothetical protein